MLEGLLTWNWSLWYKINTMLGISATAISIGLSNENFMLAGLFYALLYGTLWFSVDKV